MNISSEKSSSTRGCEVEEKLKISEKMRIIGIPSLIKTKGRFNEIRGNTVGGNFRINEGNRNEEGERLTKKIKCEVKHEGERRFESYECKDDTVGAKLRIGEEKRNSHDELLIKRVKCEMKHEGERRFINNDCKTGNADGSMPGYSNAERSATKHKIPSEGEFEGPRKRQKISLSWDMEGNDTDRRENMKELNCQLALHSDVYGCHFEGHLSEGGNMEDPKKAEGTNALDQYNMQSQMHGWIPRYLPQNSEEFGGFQEKGLPEEFGHTRERMNTSFQSHGGAERNFKAAERRSRKGTPYRRFRGDSTQYIAARDKMAAGENAEVHGILNRRSANNDRHHDWPEYRKRIMMTEQERFQLPQEQNAQYQYREDVQKEIPQFQGNFRREWMPPGNNGTYERQRHNNQQFSFSKNKEQRNSNFGRNLSANQIGKRGGTKFGDPRLGRGVNVSAQDEAPSLAMRHSRANELGRRIPFYSPGRFKQTNSNDMSTRTCVVESGKRQLLREIAHHYTSAPSVQSTPPSYSWRYFGNTPPIMHPAPLNRFGTDASSMKRRIEQTFSRGLPNKNSGSSDSQSSNSEEDDTERMEQNGQARQCMITQENSGGQKLPHAKEKGKFQLVPEGIQGYMSASSEHLGQPSNRLRHFGPIPPMMYPGHLSYKESGHARTGDRFRLDPRFLKGKIEETYARAMPTKSAASSDSPSSNSEEDDGERMGHEEQATQQVIKQDCKEAMRKECVMENEKLQLVPELSHHYALASNDHLSQQPSSSSRYFGTIPSMAYPCHGGYKENGHVRSGDRFRADPRFLKEWIKQTIKQTLPLNKSPFPDSPSSNSEEGDNERIGHGELETQHVMTQGNADGCEEAMRKELMNETGRRKLVRGMGQHYEPPTIARLSPRTYPYGHLHNIPSIMRPGHSSRMDDGHIIRSEGIGDISSQTVPHNTLGGSASHSSNSEEEDGGSLGRAQQINGPVIKQNYSDDHGDAMKNSKEESVPLTQVFRKSPTSDSQSSISEEDNSGSLGLAGQNTERVIQQENSDAVKETMGKENTQNNTLEANTDQGMAQHQNHQINIQDTASAKDKESEGDGKAKAQHSVGVASLSNLTTSEGNHQPAVNPNQKKASNDQPKHPTGKSQAEEEDVKREGVSSNPWGKGSYSDLITKALMSSPERKMTLDEIYRWISVNIPYFRDKGNEISSSGWKNSIRHTLCVRQKFVRLPRVTNGSVSRKSWWTLSDDFLRKGVKHSLALNHEKYANKETQTEAQTEMFVCHYCSFARAKSMIPERSR